jgi:predicted esterase
MFIPKGQDQRLADSKSTFFGESWPNAPHDSGQGGRGIFPTNGDAWAATNYLEAQIYYRGAILQAPACVRHHVQPGALRALAEQVGGSKIQILHGRSDKIAPYAAAERLYAAFGGDESGVKLQFFGDTGHLLTLERVGEIVASLEALTGSE